MRIGVQQSAAAGRAVPAAVVLALAAVVPSAGPAMAAPAPFTNCADSGAHFRVDSVDITPQPLVPGKKVSISVRGLLDEQLTGGSYTADVRYMGVSVLDWTGPISDLITLPAPAGPATMAASMKVPREAPEGSYELRFAAVDQNSAALTCLVVPFRIA